MDFQGQHTAIKNLPEPALEEIKAAFLKIQDEICLSLEEMDGKATFQEDNWERQGGGGGKTRVIEKGKVFEKGGVNFSHVYGILPENIHRSLALDKDQPGKFDATGVSLVIHPESPRVPIVHANIRYFQLEDGTYWFGGGIDLTPIYVVEEDAVHFHTVLNDVCSRFDTSYYSRFKSWCDTYFFIRHRQEMRGIGGIFFDHLNGENKRELFEFVKAVGEAFLPAYLPIVARRKLESYETHHKQFQSIRRSRYVEFNLVYDRGTKFGLETDGRTDSILMSMPPLAEWPYQYKPEPGSEEEKTMRLLQAREWVGEGEET